MEVYGFPIRISRHMYFCGNRTLPVHSLLLWEDTFCLVRRSFLLLVCVNSLDPYPSKNEKCVLPELPFKYKNLKNKLLLFAPSALL